MPHDTPSSHDADPGSESGAGLARRYAGIVTSLRHPACPPQTVEPVRDAIIALAHVLLASGVVTPEDLVRHYGQESAPGHPHLGLFGYHPN